MISMQDEANKIKKLSLILIEIKSTVFWVDASVPDKNSST